MSAYNSIPHLRLLVHLLTILQCIIRSDTQPHAHAHVTRRHSSVLTVRHLLSFCAASSSLPLSYYNRLSNKRVHARSGVAQPTKPDPQFAARIQIMQTLCDDESLDVSHRSNSTRSAEPSLIRSVALT